MKINERDGQLGPWAKVMNDCSVKERQWVEEKEEKVSDDDVRGRRSWREGIERKTKASERE